MKQKNSYESGGVALVGCIFVGVALGILFNHTAVGAFLGAGIGFLVMAVLRAVANRR